MHLSDRHAEHNPEHNRQIHPLNPSNTTPNRQIHQLNTSSITLNSPEHNRHIHLLYTSTITLNRHIHLLYTSTITLNRQIHQLYTSIITVNNTNCIHTLQFDTYILSLCFNGHFPGGPGLAGTRMSPFCRKWWWQLGLWSYKTNPVKSSPQTNQHPEYFTGQLPFLSPTNSVRALKEDWHVD